MNKKMSKVELAKHVKKARENGIIKPEKYIGANALREDWRIVVEEDEMADLKTKVEKNALRITSTRAGYWVVPTTIKNLLLSTDVEINWSKVKELPRHENNEPDALYGERVKRAGVKKGNPK